LATGENYGRSIAVSGRYAYISTDTAPARVVVVDIRGIETSNLMAHSLEAGSLQVKKDLTVYDHLKVGGGINVGIGGIYSAGPLSLISRSTGTTTSALDIRNSAGTSLLYVRDDGNVGIGTTAPASILELRRTNTSPILTITSATSTTFSPQIAFRTGTTPTTRYTIGTNIADNKLKIIVGSDITTSTGITIDSSGNVGIGTTSPSYLLHVFRSTDGDVAGFTDANGTCTINPTNTSLICTSDIRLKNVVGSLSHSLEKVISLNPIEYYWKNQVDSNLRFGFVAQEVEKVIPELVFTNPDDTKSLNYIGLIPFLVGAIKEQQKEIEELKLILNEYGILATNNGTASNEQLNSEQGTIFDRFTLAIKKSLEKLGLFVENGIAKVKEIIVEKLTAEIIVAKEIKTKRIITNEIQIVDKATGEIYCTWIENGEWKKVKGECEAISNQTANNETTNNHTTNNQATNSEQSNNEQSSINSSPTSTATSTEETSQEISTSTNEQLKSE
jgi:hypothetical protein